MVEENQLAVFEGNTPPTPVHSPQPKMNAPPPLTLADAPLAHHGAPSAHLPQPISTSMPPLGYAPLPTMYMPSSATQAPPPAHDPTRMATLEGNVTTLQNTVDLMAANMAEMMALLRGPNRASSSSTPPLACGLTVDPAPWVPPTHALKGDIAVVPAPTIIPAPAPRPTHAQAIHPVDFYHSQSTIPATVSLPPMMISVPDPVMFAPPPVSVLAQTTVYTVPPSMGFLTSSGLAPAHTTEPFPYQALQPHIGLPYQAPPPINITFSEPSTPTHVAPIAPPTNFLPGTETEQERRMKKMEETIKALQASDPRHNTSYLDSTLFSGMQLPAKVKVLDFQKYDGTKDPRHHLRHYHGKMLQYWDYK
ncbi:extensin-like [Punica granatum]|uniref:Extensin-like n=1 Tax=Punica granatum TaxID=22663 RepID=A0A6P8CTQ1_PUNGR|nr:extensin-like [Punica granatum]